MGGKPGIRTISSCCRSSRRRSRSSARSDRTPPMLSLAKMSIRRNIAVLVAVLGILVGGTWAAVKLATDHLLYRNATSAATGWAQYLANNVADLEQIAAGERPSAASLAFFHGARKVGHVFRYVIFNPEGYPHLLRHRPATRPLGFPKQS